MYVCISGLLRKERVLALETQLVCELYVYTNMYGLTLT